MSIDYQLEVNRLLSEAGCERPNGSALTTFELDAMITAQKNGASAETFVRWIIERRATRKGGAS